MKRSLVFVATILAPSLLAAQAASRSQPNPVPSLPHKHAPQPTVAAITAGDLMTRLYVFADDSMMGREAGTLGNFKGTDYIAAEAKRLGLVPAGENGTFFQTIPFKTRTIDTTSMLAAGATPLAFGTDWAVSTTASEAQGRIRRGRRTQ